MKKGETSPPPAPLTCPALERLGGQRLLRHSPLRILPCVGFTKKTPRVPTGDTAVPWPLCDPCQGPAAAGAGSGPCGQSPVSAPQPPTSCLPAPPWPCGVGGMQRELGDRGRQMGWGGLAPCGEPGAGGGALLKATVGLDLSRLVAPRGLSGPDHASCPPPQNHRWCQNSSPETETAFCTLHTSSGPAALMALRIWGSQALPPMLSQPPALRPVQSRPHLSLPPISAPGRPSHPSSSRRQLEHVPLLLEPSMAP